MAPVASRTVSLINVFDPATFETAILFVMSISCFGRETEPEWDQDLRGDILEECSKYGALVHVAVDKHDPKGVVYLKFQTPAAAAIGRTAMHGRFFGGKQIVAQFLPEDAYHTRFPDAAKAATVLRPN